MSRYALTAAWWALGAVLIYLLWDNSRGLIANDLLRALAAAAVLLAGSVLLGVLLGAASGWLPPRKP